MSKVNKIEENSEINDLFNSKSKISDFKEMTKCSSYRMWTMARDCSSAREDSYLIAFMENRKRTLCLEKHRNTRIYTSFFSSHNLG